MKYILYKYRILLIPLLLLSTLTNLYANSSTTGNPATVNRDSGLNALRSPALMSWQQDDSLGLGLVYTLKAYDDFEGSITLFGVSAPVDSETDSIFKGALFFSGIIRFDKHTFGFGIKNTDDAQFTISKSHTEIASSSTSIDEKKMVINISSVYSYAYRLSNRQSAGFQIETGFSRKETDEDVNDSSNYKYKTSISEGISGSISFGYSFIGKNIEAGLLITTGEFTREKTDVSYETTTPSYVKSKTGTDPEIFQNKGYGLIAGLGFRPYYKILLIFETGIEIPYTYEQKSISDDFTEVTNSTDSSGLYLARLGADYNVNRNMSAGIGFTYAQTDKETDISDGTKTEMSFSLIEINTGIEYILSNGLRLLFACNVSFIAAEMSINKSGPPVTTLEFNPDTINLGFVTGVSTYF